jgi:hypothetical protein
MDEGEGKPAAVTARDSETGVIMVKFETSRNA